jgi:hypothetical protein
VLESHLHRSAGKWLQLAVELFPVMKAHRIARMSGSKVPAVDRSACTAVQSPWDVPRAVVERTVGCVTVDCRLD